MRYLTENNKKLADVVNSTPPVQVSQVCQSALACTSDQSLLAESHIFCLFALWPLWAITGHNWFL